MKKVLTLMIVLFSQVFFSSGDVQCADIKPVGDGEHNFWPAGNDTV